MAAAPPAERKALPALAEAVGFDLLQKYISSHSHRAKQRRSSRADASRSSTAAPPSRQSTSGSHGSSQRRSSTADTRKNAHVRLRHSCNAVWPLGVAATIGGLMAGISGDGLDELAQALGVDPASASKMYPVIAKVCLLAPCGWVFACSHGLFPTRWHCAQDAELMLKDLTATSKSQVLRSHSRVACVVMLWCAPTDSALRVPAWHRALNRKHPWPPARRESLQYIRTLTPPPFRC